MTKRIEMNDEFIEDVNGGKNITKEINSCVTTTCGTGTGDNTATKRVRLKDMNGSLLYAMGCSF